MLTTLFIWSLKSSLFLALIYGTYWVLFKNNTRFQFRRTVLLLSLAIAATIPLLKVEIPIGENHPLHAAVQEIGPISFEENTTRDNLAPAVFGTTINNPQTIGWLDVVMIVYVAGLAISLSLMFIELLRLAFWYYLGARRTDIQDNVITHKGIKYPFSFWKWIFVPQGTDYDKEIWDIIEKHETAHLKQGHSFDMVFCGLSQCLLWYNPIIHLFQKELKDNHEALADRHVLKFTDLKTYAKALLSVSVSANAMKLGHSFALVSTLSKRLKAMKQEKTHFLKTVSSSLLLVTIITTIGIFNVANAQETKEEAKEVATQKYLGGAWYFMMMEKITDKHANILDKIRADHPGKPISYRYLETARYQEYLGAYQPDQKTLFFDKLTPDEQEELYNLASKDTLRSSVRIKSSPNSQYSFSINDLSEKDKKSMYNASKYIVIYESLPKKKMSDSPIYEADQVDKLPEPLGGLSNFEKSIALDAELPSDIDKTLLPKTIDFVIVINGGNNISELNLITDIKEDNDEIDKIYKFMGQLHNEILGKIRAYYPWKRGIKDGKEVRVRIKIAIPTRYM